ncbi:hypothetical protein ACEWY4_020925 [Coilia grayii]|uniref:Uncharacterized protein n=1 Tax=Coilia grayii TaxID=363190 RepID=A0ABD1J7I1_9TELE
MEDHARSTPNEGNNSLRRVKLCRHSHERTTFKVNRTHNKHGPLLKQSQSPGAGPSNNHHKAFVTPKRSRLRCSGFSYVESPDAVQDIIWESTSPPPVWNGTGPEKTPKIVDIVNRIAPKERCKEGQNSPFLQWIGNDAISCTPEVPAPRVRRTSTRQNSVEDLKKLAREFDLRINKEQQRESGPSDDRPASPEGPQGGLQAAAALDEELNALFDSSTQRLSRPLSQGSSVSSQEARANPASAAGDRGHPAPKQSSSASLSSSSSLMLHADRATAVATASTRSASGKGDFDDDWENDDLLNDSFVLEMTQHPAVLESAPAPGASTAPPPPPPRLPVSEPSDLAVKVNPFVYTRPAAPGRAGPSSGNSSDRGHSHGGGDGTGVLMGTGSKGMPTNPSTFMSAPSGHSQHKNTSVCAPRAPSLKASHAARHEHGRTHAQSSGRHTEEEAKTVAASENICKQPTGLKDHPGEAEKKNFKGAIDKGVTCQTVCDDMWGNGGDADDDLLYQVCDVVERLSASQEEARAVAGNAEPVDNRPAASFTRQLSLSPSHCASSAQADCIVKTSSWPPAQTSVGSGKRPSYTFSRSLSVPNQSSPSITTPTCAKIQAPGVSAGCGIPSRTAPPGSQGPNRQRFTQLKPPPQGASSHTPGPRGPHPTSTHQCTTKRHLHEPKPLANKVFVPNQRPVKCSAAEIERKKQDAIARRKLRLEASQKASTQT